MLKIFPGRYTAQIDEAFVVFLIGLRINRLWAFGKWMPVAKAMPQMLDDLAKNPAKGLLGVDTWVRWREVMNVQYWRSFEDLENFARRPTAFRTRRRNRSRGCCRQSRDGTPAYGRL
jgi:hypothetical protein